MCMNMADSCCCTTETNTTIVKQLYFNRKKAAIKMSIINVDLYTLVLIYFCRCAIFFQD